MELTDEQDSSATLLEKITHEMREASWVIDKLQREGYTNTFYLLNHDYFYNQENLLFKVKDFQTDNIYRFEQDSVLQYYFIYAVHDRWKDIKGIFLVDYTALSKMKLRT